MKKFFTLCALAFAAMSLNAGVNFSLEERQVVSDNLPLLSKEIVTSKVKPSAEPAVLQDGSKWLLKFQGPNQISVVDNDTTATGLASFEVKMIEEDSVHLVGFAQGYDLKGRYDRETGLLSFIFPQVIGQFSSYGDITSYMIKGTSLYEGTWVMQYGENGFTFDSEYGIYGRVSAGWLVWMDICESAAKANGVQQFVNNNAQVSLSLVGSLNSDKDLVLEGVSLIANGSYTPITLKIDKETKTITVPEGTIVDRYDAGTGIQEYVFLPLTAEGYLGSDPVKFSYTTTENSSTLTNTNEYGLFMGYATDNQGNYRGIKLSDYIITLDFPIEENPFSAVENIEVNKVAPVYYNLQGVRVENPANGLYIVVKGNKATKVIVK